MNLDDMLDHQLRAEKLHLIAQHSDPEFRSILSCALLGESGMDCGSQFRGKLVLMLSANRERMLHVALAIELIHAASLVADDLIDGSPRRRSSPALWKKYGREVALLVSHRMVALAYELTLTCSARHRRLLVQSISRMADAELSSHNTADAESYLRYMQAKTGALVQLAARLGLDPDSEAEALSALIGNIAVLHQIEDDRSDSEVDSKAPSRQGRHNLFALPETEIAKINDWSRNVCAVDFPRLRDALRPRPNADEVISMLDVFSGIGTGNQPRLQSVSSGRILLRVNAGRT